MFKHLIMGLFIIVAIITGCQESVKKNGETKEVKPVIGTADDYILNAVEATGGKKAWENIRQINLKAIVTMYKNDGTYYLTEHAFKIEPWKEKIEIACIEPASPAECVFSRGLFNVVRGRDDLHALPSELNADLYSEMVLDITTAAVRLLDNEFVFTKKGQPIKREGIVYSEIDRQQISTSESIPRRKISLMQNLEKNLVDMVLFSDKENFVIRGYDYQKISKSSILVPAQIEIFSCDKSGYLKRKLVKIDFKL